MKNPSSIIIPRKPSSFLPVSIFAVFAFILIVIGIISTSCSAPVSVTSSDDENLAPANKMYFDDEFSEEYFVYTNKIINVIKFRDGGVNCYVVLSNMYREAYPGIFCLQ